MLIIGTKEGRREFKVPFDKKEFSTPFINKIEYVVASGSELELIDNKFTINNGLTIPMTNSQSVIWFDSIAKTIIANL